MSATAGHSKEIPRKAVVSRITENRYGFKGNNPVKRCQLQQGHLEEIFRKTVGSRISENRQGFNGIREQFMKLNLNRKI